MGLISGWGSVAVHGREGFRAELASVVCLFSDRIWIARWGSPMERLLKAIGMRSRSRSSDLSDQSLARRAGLEGVADRYAVPVVSLADAVEIGMLGEFGVGKEQVSEIEAWLDDRLAEPPSGLSNPAL
jgi:hypothetical protein